MNQPARYPQTLEPAGQWVKQAACIGHADEMFPDNDEKEIENAKRICRRCPVQTECVIDALDTGDYTFGIRGGLRPNERRNLDRQMGRRAKTAPDKDAEPAPAAKRTFESLWAERTKRLENGHMEWTSSVPVPLNGRYYTPMKIGFRIDRGRAPIGVVRRTCVHNGCVMPAHVMDQAERNAARRAANA